MSSRPSATASRSRSTTRSRSASEALSCGNASPASGGPTKDGRFSKDGFSGDAFSKDAFSPDAFSEDGSCGNDPSVNGFSGRSSFMGPDYVLTPGSCTFRPRTGPRDRP